MNGKINISKLFKFTVHLVDHQHIEKAIIFQNFSSLQFISGKLLFKDYRFNFKTFQVYSSLKGDASDLC